MSLVMLFDSLLHRLRIRKASVALTDSFVTTITISDALVTSLALTDEDCD